jgi:hypothetical protein
MPDAKLALLSEVETALLKVMNGALGKPLRPSNAPKLAEEVKHQIEQTLSCLIPDEPPLRIEVVVDNDNRDTLDVHIYHPDVAEPLIFEIYLRWVADRRLGINPVPFAQYYPDLKRILES